MADKCMKECSRFFSHSEDAYQNYTEIPSHPSQNVNHQENQTTTNAG
jgi:hypothetical protein